jgi:hypothetical protein
MADRDKAFGQHMEQPATDEFQRIQGLGFPLAVGAVLVAQEHAALAVATGEPVLVEGGLADIAGEVTQGAATASGRAAVNHPILIPDARIDALVELWVLDG